MQKTKPGELVNRLEQQEKKAKKEEQKARDYSELMRPKESKAGPVKGEIPYKKLEDIMKLDLVEGKSVEEITKIWLAYHTQKDTIAAVIPTAAFDKLMLLSKKYPLFIFPIPRSQGYEFMMFQFAANTIHFTPLLCYQVSRSFEIFAFALNRKLSSSRCTKKTLPNASTSCTTPSSENKESS